MKKILPGPAQSIKTSGRFTAWGGVGITQASEGIVGPRPAWPELWPEAPGLGWAGGWRCGLSSQGRHPAGWALPQPCLPPIPNPSPFFLLLDCWSPHLPSFQLFLVTTDPWPWTDQTSTKNKSLLQADGVLFPAQALQVEVHHGERRRCLPQSPPPPRPPCGAGQGQDEPSSSQACVASERRLLWHM